MTSPWWEDCCDDPDGIDKYDAFMREKYWVIEQLRKLHLPETPREFFNEDCAYDLLVDDDAEAWKLNYWGADKAAVIDALVRSDIRYPNTGGNYTKVEPLAMQLWYRDPVALHEEKILRQCINFINPDMDDPNPPYIAFNYLLAGDVIGEGKYYTTFYGGHDYSAVPNSTWTGLRIVDDNLENAKKLDAIAPWRHRAMAVFRQDVEKVLAAKISIGPDTDQEIATLLHMDKHHPGEKFVTTGDGSVWLWRKD